MYINYNRKKREVYITHQKYIDEIVEMLYQVHARATNYPCDQSTKSSGDDSSKTDAELESMSRIPYRQLL
ncbi:hypothetical protein PsorP6_014643 [Peronosclerospora sorghi]|uniref:Uncharacterized protein n=1 Tax=Peronosclerospora sorghi TaxID=230839 RepID=A0ACC0VUV2_9STRA|nr:hypothetical protein PsorP6_014643 [Peronosclerospora sorghi]